MEYGAIIKRAWQITWRHKALWILGVFAGISGCQSGGSGGGGGGTGWSGDPTDFGWSGNELGWFREVESVLESLLPVFAALLALLVMVWLLWAILGVAARGGLVVGVSEVEEGREHGLGTLWGAGFKRFWSVLGLEILVGLPIVLITLLMLFGVFAPLVGPLIGGQEPGAEIVAPICGSLCLGIPVLIVLSLLLGVLRLVALRYIMLGGQGAIEALGNSWRFFRARMKDTVVMYLINAGLNIVAGIVLAIPAVIISVIAVVPVVMAASERNWAAITAPIALLVLALVALSIFYTAVWGTYTSALWTLFFRRVTGMDVAVAAAPAPASPPAPEYPADVVPPGPPIAGFSETPSGEPIAPPPPAPPAGEMPTPPPAPSSYPQTPPVPPAPSEDSGASESSDEQA